MTSKYILTKSPGQTFSYAKKRKQQARLDQLKANEKPSAFVPQYRPLPSLKRLKQLFNYDSTTGLLTCKLARGGLLVSDEVGTPLGGYRSVFVDYQQWRVHRVCFKMHFGRDPVGVVHHKNGIRDDNRIANLVEATPLQNAQQRHNCNSNTGVIGVSFCKSSQRYLADIGWNNRVVHLGRFVHLDCAIKCRQHAERVLYEFDRRELEAA